MRSNIGASEGTFQRLLRFSGSGEPDPREMARLMREHLRRMAAWASALGCEDSWPFFDLAAKVQPEVRASVEEVTRIEEHLRSLHLSERIVRACVWALRWDQVRALPAVADCGLLDPFEPLIALFELGGRFTTEHGYVDLDGAAFRLGRVADWLPVVTDSARPSVKN